MKKLKVPGIHCDNCVARINEGMSKNDITVKVHKLRKLVEFDDSKYDESKIVSILDDLGFEVK